MAVYIRIMYLKDRFLSNTGTRTLNAKVIAVSFIQRLSTCSNRFSSLSIVAKQHIEHLNKPSVKLHWALINKSDQVEIFNRF